MDHTGSVKGMWIIPDPVKLCGSDRGKVMLILPGSGSATLAILSIFGHCWRVNRQKVEEDHEKNTNVPVNCLKCVLLYFISCCRGQKI